MDIHRIQAILLSPDTLQIHNITSIQDIQVRYHVLFYRNKVLLGYPASGPPFGSPGGPRMPPGPGQQGPPYGGPNPYGQQG